ncbi:hypothetical protein [Sphingobacterium sp. MYb382]|uniref:hypothetical protein n=1 Tax=Sphingobacterium sp. MYb382 TaxID=2745278 RepID=UPI0030A5B181
MQKNILKPPKQNDELLKAMFEANFLEFLCFMYPNAKKRFDLTKEIEFLNKELLEISPYRARKRGKRIVDILAKIRKKEEQENWIIVHTEIQSSIQKDLAFRLFQYHYRLIDRYRSPIETIAFFIGAKHEQGPTSYKGVNLKTKIYFHYPSYHIFDHHEKDLLAMNNIFGLIILTCQKATMEGKVSDEDLGKERLLIAKEAIRRNYPYDNTLKFLIFLKNFLYIDVQEIDNIFNKQLFQWTGGSINMDVLEVIKKQEREKGKLEGLQEGKLKGLQEGKLKGLQEGKLKGLQEGKLKGLQEGKLKGLQEGKHTSMLSIAAEMKKEGFPIDKIEQFTKLSITEIQKI